MRRSLAILALLTAACSPSEPGKKVSPSSTPGPQAGQANFPGAATEPMAASAAASGGSSGSASSSAPQASPPAQQNSVSPYSGSGTRPRRPPIEPGLWRMPGYQPSLSVRNPGSDTLARGFTLYKDNCSMCHGADLRGELSAPGVPVRDLTRFQRYKFGSSDQAIYRSIVYGIPKTAMGNFQSSLKPQQVWDVINYMKSKRTD